jgi:hypothetical protein
MRALLVDVTVRKHSVVHRRMSSDKSFADLKTCRMSSSISTGFPRFSKRTGAGWWGAFRKSKRSSRGPLRNSALEVFEATLLLLSGRGFRAPSLSEVTALLEKSVEGGGLPYPLQGSWAWRELVTASHRRLETQSAIRCGSSSSFKSSFVPASLFERLPLFGMLLSSSGG